MMTLPQFVNNSSISKNTNTNTSTNTNTASRENHGDLSFQPLTIGRRLTDSVKNGLFQTRVNKDSDLISKMNDISNVNTIKPRNIQTSKPLREVSHHHNQLSDTAIKDMKDLSSNKFQTATLVSTVCCEILGDYFEDNDHFNSIPDIPISPMFTESKLSSPRNWGDSELSSSSGRFFGRGSTSFPTSRSTIDSSRLTNNLQVTPLQKVANHSSLPGLLNSKNMQQRIHGTGAGAGSKGEGEARDRRLTTQGGDNCGTSLFASKLKNDIKQDAHLNVKTFKSDTGSAGSGAGLGATDTTEVTPWAFKIINEFNSGKYNRPQSRCTSRFESGENGGGRLNPVGLGETHSKSESNLFVSPIKKKINN